MLGDRGMCECVYVELAVSFCFYLIHKVKWKKNKGNLSMSLSIHIWPKPFDILHIFYKGLIIREKFIISPFFLFLWWFFYFCYFYSMRFVFLGSFNLNLLTFFLLLFQLYSYMIVLLSVNISTHERNKKNTNESTKLE